MHVDTIKGELPDATQHSVGREEGRRKTTRKRELKERKAKGETSF